MRKILALALVIVMAAAASGAAAASKKPRPSDSQPSVTYDDAGTPIIMQGLPKVKPLANEPMQQAERPVHIPRGSSTYIPPPNPSPYSANSPPPASALQPPPQPYKPPPINSFSDRVVNCIHSFPLQGGIGNNPSNQQAYVRQCAN